MKAWLEPLKDKYYGTHVCFNHPTYGKSGLVIWMSDNTISEREAAQWGITKEQWDKNEKVTDRDGYVENAKDMDITCDGHYESETTYQLAVYLKECLEKYMEGK